VRAGSSSASPSHLGRHRDVAVPWDDPELPETTRLYADGAYRDYDKEHPNLEFPCRKPRDGKPIDEQKAHDRRPRGFRIASGRFLDPLATQHTRVSTIAGLVNLKDGFGPF